LIDTVCPAEAQAPRDFFGPRGFLRDRLEGQVVNKHFFGDRRKSLLEGERWARPYKRVLQVIDSRHLTSEFIVEGIETVAFSPMYYCVDIAICNKC
jgi:hypothetical protein